MDTNAPQKVDQSGNGLILETIQAYEGSLHLRNTPNKNIEKDYDKRYVLTLGKRLSLPEITILLKATQLREEGLKLLRSGDKSKGGEFLQRARSIYESAGISQEANYAAESYQTAAEAYLYYKEEAYSEAYGLLKSTLDFCKLLREQFEYDVEIRRIHIAQNMVRVLNYASEPIEAMKIACSLLKYTLGFPDSWPIPNSELRENPEVLANEEKYTLLDQIIFEIHLILDRHNSSSLDLVRTIEDNILQDTSISWNDFPSIYQWFATQVELRKGRYVNFLKNAKQFYLEFPQHLKRAHQILSEQLLAMNSFLQQV